MKMIYAVLAFGIILTAGMTLGRAETPKSPPVSNTDEPDQIRLPPRFQGQQPKSILFLIDASTSMAGKADVLKQELRKGIDGLKPEQSFDILFFADGKCQSLDKLLLPATPANKRKAVEFLAQFKPQGNSDPIAGLGQAFAAKPELIYLLAAGPFPKNVRAVEEIRKLNKDQTVAVNTIAFIDRGEAYEKVLKQIADENVGLFKFVSNNEVK